MNQFGGEWTKQKIEKIRIMEFLTKNVLNVSLHVCKYCFGDKQISQTNDDTNFYGEGGQQCLYWFSGFWLCTI